MSDPNENRPGYKETKVGWIPDDWGLSTVGQLCDFVNGNGFKKSDWSSEGYPIIRIQNLNGSQDFNYFSGEINERWLVEPGTLLFAWAGTKGVSFGPTVWRGRTGVLNQHIYKVLPDHSIDESWFFRILKRVTGLIEANSHGFKATLLHVQKSDVVDQRVPLPQRCEQQKIAEILSTCDEAIEKTSALIDSKKRQKKALMQQLLTGKKRLPGFEGEWKTLKFSELFERVTRKNTIGCDNNLTISGSLGLINQEEYFNKRIAAKDVSGYFLLKRGELAYNKSYSKGYPLGAIKMLTRYDEGVVSTLYICFRLKEGAVDTEFVRHYFESPAFNHELYKVAQEGARNHGLLNVAPADFFNTHLLLPEGEEQTAIARVLGEADRELGALGAKLKTLKQQKKALMQKLLTGQVRVKV